MGNQEYLNYLQSSEWKQTCKVVRCRANGACERCGDEYAESYNVHHLTYERLYNELLSDLQYLCRPCHEFIHSRRSIDPASHAWKNLNLYANLYGVSGLARKLWTCTPD